LEVGRVRKEINEGGSQRCRGEKRKREEEVDEGVVGRRSGMRMGRVRGRKEVWRGGTKRSEHTIRSELCAEIYNGGEKAPSREVEAVELRAKELQAFSAGSEISLRADEPCRTSVLLCC